ncbi:MAG TPA: M20 family metallopeptidase [Ktedonobacterales bacterium]|nr:M20 family metallopeptidase [Ktedonobacterales bacterium]
MDSVPSALVSDETVAAFLDDLRALVNINSGTYTPEGVARVADYLQPLFVAMGCEVERVPGNKMGPQLIVRHTGSGHGRVLIIGHMDTVFPDGEADRRPFDIHDGCAYGPGVFDMKSGLLVALYAVRGLIESGETPWQTLTMICNSDEEIGSPESHDLIETEAKQADAALVLEPTSEPSRVTIARKGAASFTLEIRGIAAHAGVEPHRGRSAILEMAHRIVALHSLNGTIPGVTVNVGVVQGGERPNVVAETAYAEIDVRAADEEGVQAIEAALARVVADTDVPDTTAMLEGFFAHRPFTQSSRSARLFALAAEAGNELGIALHGEPTGGASDGNTTAGLGTPTLDGLGLVGGLAHNPGEFVEISSIAPRIALLTGILRRLNGVDLSA